MKNLKKVLAVVLSASFALTAVNLASAAEVSTKYNKTYMETFSDSTKVFGDDGIFEVVQNVTDDSVKVVDSNQGGKHLEVISSNNSDVQIRTKKGVFKHEVTVIDMNVSGVLGTQAFPLIRLTNNGAKMDTGNGVFRFVSTNKTIRSYNQVTGVHDVVTIDNEWVNVRIILDSENKTITTAFNGSQATTVSQMSNEWDNANVQMILQSATNSTLRIDDLTVSDGTYMENIYMVQDFEHSSKVNQAVGNGFFYNIIKTQNPTVVYDASSKNTYLDITNASGNMIYTAWTINTLTTPTVVEFDMKATSASGAAVRLNRDSNKAATPLFAENEIKTDGKFHKYRATVLPLSTGYKVIKLIDNNYSGYNEFATGAYCGSDARLEIEAGAVSTDIAIDNLKVYYPQEAKLFCDLDGKEGVKIDTAIEMVSNTLINAESAKNAVITANGEPVKFTYSSDGNKNSYIFNIEGGLKKGKTYVISTGETGMKDMFEQYYNTTITFTTEEADVIGGDDSLFQFGANANNSNVAYVDSAQGGQNLKVTSTNNTDVQINTKKGILQYDVTVVDMSVRAGVSGTFPQIKLMNNGAKFGNQSLFIFVDNANNLRAYDVVNGTYNASTSGNEWKDLRVIFDSINKTITAKINGSEAVSVSTFDSAWDNKNIQMNFQVANNSSILIDDVVISDGSDIKDMYIDHDFEHSNVVNAEVGNNHFYNIYKTKNPKPVYDAENANTYLDITNAEGNTIYTNWNIDMLKGSTVVEVDMKATSASGTTVGLKRNSNKAITPMINESEIIADGEFHTYKFVVIPRKAGYKVIKTVDGVSLSSNEAIEGAHCGSDARLEIFAGAASTDIAIDNLKVYNVPDDVEGKITYTVNGEAPTDSKIKTGDAINVTFDLKSNIQAGAVANGYIACYNASGEVVSVQIVELEATGKGSDNDSDSIASVGADVNSIKLLLWDNDMNPVTGYIELVK